jgi:hypothetical protein
MEKNESNKNYAKHFLIIGATTILTTGIIKGPDYIKSLNKDEVKNTIEYNQSLNKLLSDTTFQNYLQQRANSAEKFIENKDYSSKNLDRYLKSIYGRNPLE